MKVAFITQRGGCFYIKNKTDYFIEFFEFLRYNLIGALRK